ncbi:MAG: cell division protein ZapA [Flavobacteriales bacterium]|nr:cell division protein ZapA [Flavobacteriales bacterium]
MGELSIRVNIAGRTYPLTIDSSEETVIRHAEESIETSIRQFQQNYAVKDKQDLLAMAALQVAAKNHGEKKQHPEQQPASPPPADIAPELLHLQTLVDGYLSS